MVRLPTPPPLSPFVRGAAALPLLIGHRGTRVHAPENSRAAFRWATAAGADAVELDVRQCGSGELVVVHDDDMSRVAGSPLRVAASSYAQLRALSLGEGQHVPLLAEVVDELRVHGLLVHVEVKANGADVNVPALCDAVIAWQAGLREDQRVGCCVSSFSRRVLSALQAACAGLTLAGLFEEGAPGPASGVADDAGDDVRGRTAGVHPHHGLATPSAIAGWRMAGRFVNAWTVNDAQLARTLSADGVDGIIADDVEALRAAL